MLGLEDRKSKKIRKEMLKKRDNLIRQAEEMRKLTLTPNSGWDEFNSILDNYVNACMKRKAVTALDTATEKEIYELKLIDHEVFLIKQFIQVIPKKIFFSEQEMEKQIRQEQKGNESQA